MRRIWALCAALVLLAGSGAGCSGRSAPDQSNIKQAFIRQLIGFCAEVDRQLANIDMNRHPDIYADQFARFVSQARSQPPPDVDREQFKIMMTEFDAIVRDFRAAQTALSAGDQRAAQDAVAQAIRQVDRTNAAAQKYGMPPLKTCPDHESSPPAPSPSTTAPAEAWQPRHASLAAVQQVGAAVLDGQIWVAGGLTTTSTKATAATQVYDPATDAWHQGPSLPEAVDHAMLVTYRNQVVLIGGFVSRGGTSVASSQVLFYDDSIGHWQKLPSLHHPRAAGAAAVVGDKIVVVGGRIGPEQLVGQTEVYDGAAWRDGKDIPVPGDHLTAASDRSYLYAVGGRKFRPQNDTNVVQRYDPATNRWTPTAALPERLSGAGAAIINGQLLVAGGESTTPAVVSTVRAYDLTAANAAWTTLPSLTQARHGLAVTAIGNTLYAIGGSTRPGHTASTNTVDALNVPARPTHPAAAWQPRHASLAAVQQVGAAVLDGQIWVAGGLTTTSTKATAATQVYDPATDAWHQGPSLPEAVDHAMLVTYRNQVVLIGGFVSRGGTSVASSQVLFYDDSAGHWQKLPSLHHPRAAGAAAVVGDKIVVVGGRIGPEQLVGQTEVYDGAAWRDGKDIPVPGDHLTAASDRSYLYAVGGRKFRPQNDTNVVQRYDPATNRWTPTAALPERLSGAGAAIINGQLLVAGGESTTPAVVSTVRAYDLTAANAAWTTLPSLTQARHGLAVTAIGNTLYAIGGSTRPGHTASTNTVDALTFS